MAVFVQELLAGEPAEVARALAPLVLLLEELLQRAEAAGFVRSGISRRRVVGVVLGAIMFHAFSATVGAPSARPGDPDPGEELWDLVFSGIGAGRGDGGGR
jgi:hypothetical protein